MQQNWPTLSVSANFKRKKMSTDRTRKTTTKRIINPSLEIGSESFSNNQIGSAKIHTHEEGRSEFRSASVTLNPPFEGRWDYHAEVRIYEDDELILTGICSEAKHGEGGRLHLKLWGPRWRIERTALYGLGTFGMSNKENFYWVTKLTNPTMDPFVEGLELDNTLRPFMFAVPLNNLVSSGNLLFLSTDTGIASHEYENLFKPILAQFEEIEGEPAWNDENPKIFGVVFAKNLLQADDAARERAELMAGIINLALRTGMSHFETRYGGDLITFKAETTLTPVSLHPWIVIRESSQVKGWIRKIPTAKLESVTSLEDSLDRIRFFLSEFIGASESRNIDDQLGKRELSARERRLLQGTNRALRWLNIASSEVDTLDKFTASWIALESILNAITYPGVFEGQRAMLKDEIKRELRKISFPNATRESLTITSGMLESRVLRNDWSLPRKLPIFAESLGIKLKTDDKKLVSKLSKARNTILHGGDDSLKLSLDLVNQLRYLVERLIVGVSIGGYEDLEDGTHNFHIGTIGPEGGAAPISIDGNEDVPYEFRATRNSQGQLVGEWIAEGKIYSEKNIKLV
ncbi:MAG: hypothetical protein F4X72_02345 [Dehalococcoidia bacterium]|nr:hypothetical protein [Dehalococcoidia bacterium]